MNDKKTILTVIIPAFAACAYLAGAVIAANKNMKKMFTVMSGLMTGVFVTSLISFLKDKDEAEEN
ncbi:MAG: hypothetical protein IJ737_03575 [Ruminococcus sp.]|nr:hypothetical protein [Ruminococcus sp.]